MTPTFYLANFPHKLYEQTANPLFDILFTKNYINIFKNWTERGVYPLCPLDQPLLLVQFSLFSAADPGGAPGARAPPLTLGFEAPKLSILLPYLIFP